MPTRRVDPPTGARDVRSTYDRRLLAAHRLPEAAEEAFVRTIVVGVDGSAPSLRSLELAADLARDLGAELVVVFARHVYLAMPVHVAEEIYGDVLDRAAREISSQVEVSLQGHDLDWRFETHEGHPADVLCDVASRTGASLIVAGRSGWSTLRDMVLGSVSNRLAHCDLPVLLVS
jgi:nucleotide-binding universal stress UspA family protein